MSNESALEVARTSATIHQEWVKLGYTKLTVYAPIDQHPKLRAHIMRVVALDLLNRIENEQFDVGELAALADRRAPAYMPSGDDVRYMVDDLQQMKRKRDRLRGEHLNEQYTAYMHARREYERNYELDDAAALKAGATKYALSVWVVNEVISLYHEYDLAENKP